MKKQKQELNVSPVSDFARKSEFRGIFGSSPRQKFPNTQIKI